MKSYAVPASQLVAEMREAINNNEQGKYLLYGIFVYADSVSISRLHKGDFSEIQLVVADTAQAEQAPVTPAETYYLFPVPEYVVDQRDQDFSRFLQIHIMRESELRDEQYKSENNPEGLIPDDVLMKTFTESFMNRLSEVADEVVADEVVADEESATEMAEATTDYWPDALERDTDQAGKAA